MCFDLVMASVTFVSHFSGFGILKNILLTQIKPIIFSIIFLNVDLCLHRKHLSVMRLDTLESTLCQ